MITEPKTSLYDSLFYGLMTGTLMGVLTFGVFFAIDRNDRRAAAAIYNTVYERCADTASPTAVDLGACAKEAHTISKAARKHR